MKFEEIFDEDGLYVADSFVTGYCLQVDKGILRGVQYADKDDLLPEKHNALCYKGLFEKEYKKVYTRQSLFKL